MLISNATGEATAYSLFYLQDRGAMMIDPQTRVYEGMIVGQHTRDNDLVVNIIQGKKLTNVRAAGKDENVILTPPMRLTLERALVLHRRRRAGRGDAEVDPRSGSAGSTPNERKETRAGARGPEGDRPATSLGPAGKRVPTWSTSPAGRARRHGLCKSSQR